MENITTLAFAAYAFLFLASCAFNFYMVPIIALGAVVDYIKRRVIKVSYKPVLYCYSFILLGGVILNYFSDSGIVGVLTFLLVNTLFIYMYIFLNAVNKKKHLNFIINSFAAGGVTLSLICLLQFYKFFAGNYYELEKIIGFRPPGLVEYFFAGLYLIYTGFFLFSKLLNGEYLKKGSREKIYFSVILISFIINYEAIILNQSRAAIYTFIFICAVMSFYRFNWRKVLLSFLLIFGVYFSNPKSIRGFSEHLTVKIEDNNPRQKSDNMRRMVYRGAWEIYKKNPITGIGNAHHVSAYWMQSYMRKLAQDKNEIVNLVDEREFQVMSEAHSMYFNLLMKNGILILAFLIQFFIIIPSLFIKVLKKAEDSEDRANIIGVGAGIAGFLITGITWYLWNYLVEIQEVFQFLTFILLFYYQKLVVEEKSSSEINSLEPVESEPLQPK